MAPFFSVIVPVYNVEAYLKRCIRSILSQSFSDMELILVNDGSTDGSSRICDAYARRFECIRVIHQKNGGLSSARNAGLEAAAGAYIWFVDSDDWVRPGALNALYSACADGKNDIVKFGYDRLEGKSTEEIRLRFSGIYDSEEKLDTLRTRALREPGKYVLSAWSHAYRREFLKKHALAFVSERDVGSEDYLFNLLCLMHAGRMTVIDQPLYSYEQRAGSLSQRYKPDLPQRYARLYAHLKAYEKNCAAMARFGAMTDRFYVWHLMFGCCIQYEYRMLSEAHGMDAGRRNVKRILEMQDFRRALRTADRAGLTWKRRLYLLAMKLKCETVFYYLYAVRKEKKR